MCGWFSLPVGTVQPDLSPLLGSSSAGSQGDKIRNKTIFALKLTVFGPGIWSVGFIYLCLNESLQEYMSVLQGHLCGIKKQSFLCMPSRQPAKVLNFPGIRKKIGSVIKMPVSRSLNPHLEKK